MRDVAANSEQAGQWFAAKWHLDRLIESKPDTTRRFTRRRVASFQQLKREAEAEADYRKAIQLKLKPGYVPPQNNLGKILEAQGKHEEAIVLQRQAIRLKPDLAEAHIDLGKALNEKGQFDEAVAVLRKAIELDPKSVYAHLHLGGAFFNKRKLDDAIDEWREAISLIPTTRGLTTI